MGGGGGGRSLSKLSMALTVIFVISLMALLAQLFYALWRRRRQTYRGGAVGEGASVCSSSDSTFSSKELLYFFCIRPHTDLDSDSIGVTSTNEDPSSNRQLDMEVVDIDLLKLQGMFGPPRFLFTIKEEEREGFESPDDKSQSLYPADKEAKKIDDYNRNNRLNSEDCFEATEDSVVEVVVEEVDGVGGNDATPFSTPYASPMYFTPSASPAHNAEEGRICSENKTAPLVTQKSR